MEEGTAIAGGPSPEFASGSRGLCSGRCRRPIQSASAPRCRRSCSPPPPTSSSATPTPPPPLHHARRRRPPPPPRLSPALDSLAAAPPSPFPRAIFLFPANPLHLPAVHLADFSESARGKAAREKGLVLLVFDGLWSHAKEMVRASQGFLGGFAAQVSLGFDASANGGSIFDDDLVLRKEPFGGCVSTVEAVARALRLLEPNGAEVEDRLLGVLRAMVRLQAGYLKPIKPRPRLEKKGKKKRREEEGGEGNVDTSEC